MEQRDFRGSGPGVGVGSTGADPRGSVGVHPEYLGNKLGLLGLGESLWKREEAGTPRRGLGRRVTWPRAWPRAWPGRDPRGGIHPWSCLRRARGTRSSSGIRDPSRGSVREKDVEVFWVNPLGVEHLWDRGTPPGIDSVRVLRLTLPQELPGERREQAKQKPVGKAFAMVANRSSNGHSLASECVKSNEGDEEIIKVVLEQHNGSWKGPERLRGDSWEEQEENCSSQDVGTLQETARRLLRRLQEAEKRHQLERKAFERKVAQYQEEAERASSALRRAERDVEQKEGQVDELQRLLAGMEKNLEMHDRIEHLIEKQVSRGGHSARARSKSEYVSSKRLTGPKPLPLIRVVET
ncbi:tuftelin [Manacus vitellinus]|uniref:tuftelin n=1 Tax=Manacus vitellinus TaxID=328815 RepID=UPI00115E5E39|nr:tuftelin [Manacus vitellinus]